MAKATDTDQPGGTAPENAARTGQQDPPATQQGGGATTPPAATGGRDAPEAGPGSIDTRAFREVRHERLSAIQLIAREARAEEKKMVQGDKEAARRHSFLHRLEQKLNEVKALLIEQKETTLEGEVGELIESMRESM
jgi:hypothetical protein